MEIFLLDGVIPDESKTGPTTLIPKKCNYLEDINNWIPISVTSAVFRLLNKILANRLDGTLTLRDYEAT